MVKLCAGVPSPSFSTYDTPQLKMQFGINAFDEGKTLSSGDNNALMVSLNLCFVLSLQYVHAGIFAYNNLITFCFVQMEVFEIREQINDTSNPTDLMRLHSNLKEDVAQIERAFAQSVEDGNQSRALLYAVRLKYYNKASCVMMMLLE